MAVPETAMRSSTANTTRSRSSVSAIAARITSRSGTGSDQVRGGLLAREHQQALGVAPHAGGEVVEPEQVGQRVRVLLPASRAR